MTYEQEATMLGKAITSTFEVIDLEPGRRITIRTTESTFPIEVTRSVEPAGTETCVARARITGDPSGAEFASGSAVLVQTVATRDPELIRRLAGTTAEPTSWAAPRSKEYPGRQPTRDE